MPGPEDVDTVAWPDDRVVRRAVPSVRRWHGWVLLEVEGGLIESLERFVYTKSGVKVVKLDVKIINRLFRAKTDNSWLRFS